MADNEARAAELVQVVRGMAITGEDLYQKILKIDRIFDVQDIFATDYWLNPTDAPGGLTDADRAELLLFYSFARAYRYLVEGNIPIFDPSLNVEAPTDTGATELGQLILARFTNP